GQSPEPHKKKLVLGIDLGTTHSLIASVKGGVATCLEAPNGQRLLDSVVHYTQDSIYVGQLETVPVNCVSIASIKRFIGRSAQEVEALIQAYPVSYSWDLSHPAVPQVITPQGLKTPVEISSEILKALKKRAAV